MCERAKFWDRLILPQILVVFKSPTTKIDFVEFLQIQVAFWKTNYTKFSYLLMPIYGLDMSENDFLTLAANFDFARFLQTFALKWALSGFQWTEFSWSDSLNLKVQRVFANWSVLWLEAYSSGPCLPIIKTWANRHQNGPFNMASVVSKDRH